jgi:hypothetical protein
MKIDNLNMEFGTIRFQFISGLVKIFSPKELYVTEVDNWFDSQWLNFSGKVLGALGVYQYGDNATIPPFNPKRITGEGILDRIEAVTEKEVSYKLRTDDYYRFIHVYQPSGNNLNRKIKHISKDALFVWYSENTDSNNIGCIMIYLIKNDEVNKFYVSFENKTDKDNKENWNILKAVGINSNEVKQYLEAGISFPINLA